MPQCSGTTGATGCPCNSFPPDAIILYNGHLKVPNVITAVGKYNGSDYALVYPDVITFIPFRPAHIEGNYTTAIFSNKSPNGIGYHVITSPERNINLPPEWNNVSVFIYR